MLQDVDVQVDDSVLVDYASTETDGSREFRCTDCGYGAIIRRGLPPCPMCGGSLWESLPPRARD